LSVALDLTSVHTQHAEFVWACLQRFGVRRSDLADVHQDVFVLVHKKLPTYDGRASLRSWIFGICRRKAAAYRRTAWFRREKPTDIIDDWSDDSTHADPESIAEMHQARAILQSILERMDVDKRLVFVMFEFEGKSCEEIAETIGIPVGTVYSRLHTARQFIEKAVTRRLARETKGGAS
jgi:RNA polymerase sigma-70 factor (ECF subfamily)